LHEKEGGAGIYREHALKQGLIGGQNVTPIRKTGGIHKDIDASEGIVSNRYDSAAIRHAFQVGLNEANLDARLILDLPCDRSTFFLVPATGDEASRPGISQLASNRGAEALCASGNDCNLPIDSVHFSSPQAVQ